jgi:hypothetical protein
MFSRKAALLLAAIAIGVLVIGIVIQFQLQNGGNFSQMPFQPPPKPVLKVSAYVSIGYWTRNINTDLPDYVSNIEYSVLNVGNANATNVHVTVYVDGNLYGTSVIPSLAASQTNAFSFTMSTTYDSMSSLLVQASCEDSTDSQAVFAGSSLPRYWSGDPGVVKLYLTPNEANLASMKDAIVRSKFFLIPNWIALRDWVGNNIKYRYDNDTHGVCDYWQLPKETLELGTGDCEDYAILLCSLLRADGWSSSDAFVVLGKNAENRYHAWVKINLGILGWYNIEPQGNGWNTLIGDFLSLSGYTAMYQFNDQQFKQIG